MADNLGQLKEKLYGLERQSDIMVDKIHELDRELGRMKESIRDIEKIVEDIEK